MIGDKILIVDDEPTNVEIFDLMLGKIGFKTETAADGVEALEKVRSFGPALILLDNMMPRMTGWEVTRAIKQGSELSEFRDVSIIMFSAADDVEDKVKGLELGVDVLARIRAVLHRRHLQDQVTRREHRIGIIESLNESLIFFSRHMREPIQEQLRGAEELRDGSSDTGDLVRFAERVKDDSQKILAKLDGLEQEIGELRRQEGELKAGDLSLDELHRRLLAIATGGATGSKE